jgi:hypothetical protein
MSLVYIILFILGCFIFSQIERFYKIPSVKWIFIIPFCLIIANRSLDVPDTSIYLNYLITEDPSISYYENYGFEVGFQTFTKIAKSIVDDNYYLYFTLITLTNLLVIDLALTRIINIFCREEDESFKSLNSLESVELRNKYSILPLTLYVAYFGIYFNAIVLRVGISLSLLVLSASFAIKPQKNILDYSIIVALLFVGYLFHAIAVLGIIIILILIYSKQQSLKTYVWICSLIGIIYFSNLTSRLGDTVFGFITSLNTLSLLSSKLSNYSGDSTMFGVSKISTKFVFFWLMSFVLIFNQIESKVYYKFLNVFITGLALYGLFRSVLLVDRATDFFLLFSFVVFYLFLIKQSALKFWFYYIFIVLLQLTFVLRITNNELV